MTKELRKAIMSRSKLRNTFLKTTNEESKKRFNRERNFGISLLRKTKRRFFFGKPDHRVVSDNRKFSKTIGPLFSENAFHKEFVIMNNNNKTVSNYEKLAEIFNIFQ